MFDIGWQELFIVAILALIVVGPKDLPMAIRTITIWIRKAKMMTREFQSGVNEMVREAGLDDIKDTMGNPQNIKQSMIDAVDPTGELAKGMTLSEDDLKADAVEAENPTMTIGEAIDAGVVEPEGDESDPVDSDPVDSDPDDSDPDDSGMAVKRKPKPEPEPDA